MLGGTMNITVRLFAGLKCENKKIDCYEKNDFRIEIEEKLTLQELLSLLEIPTSLAKIILVNGLHQPTTYNLTCGDEVSVFPPVGGG